MAKTRTEVLKEKYSFHPDSIKYVLPGAEILKYIGQDIALLEFTKNAEGKWESNQKKARIDRLYDFEPMTMTYMCDYQVGNVDGEYDPEIKSIRIQPEGASYENPEETGEAKRFLPISKRFEVIEDGLFYSRVAELWDSRKTLPIDSLKELSDSKDQGIQLRYSRNVGAAIVLDEDNTILYIRIHKLKLNHKAGNKYSLRIENDDRYWTCMISSDDETYDFEGLGKMKIIDLMSE